MTTKFKLSTDWSKCNGTCLRGHIDISYDELCAVFGTPTLSDGHKTDAEWIIVLDDETVATIYNYKDGRNYLGPDGLDTQDIRDWHIGGHDHTVIATICKIITEHREERIKELK